MNENKASNWEKYDEKLNIRKVKKKEYKLEN